MKVCEVCGEEICTQDGENRCNSCEEASNQKKKRATINRKARAQALESLGMVKVRGAMGGTYWE